MFETHQLSFETNLFDGLSTSVKFEETAKGREGCTVVFLNDNAAVPLVRTTTNYKNPPQRFSSMHVRLMDNIVRVCANESLRFNNALVEVYDDRYCSMGYHSDQALDLSDNSHICIFSCYRKATTGNLRTLRIKNKETNDCFDIPLKHNSCVLFSTDTNSRYLHKIILQKQSRDNDEWLGITLRQSKTFVYYDDGKVFFTRDKKQLTLASDEEQKEFFKMRSLENKTIGYKYPDITYTVSNGDMLPIV